MNVLKALIGLVLATCLAACEGRGFSRATKDALPLNTDTQSAPGVNTQALSAAEFNTLDGGAIPANLFARLNGSAKKSAMAAEFRALESVPSGVDVTWVATDKSAAGSVRTSQPYQVGSSSCRQYSHQVTFAGQNSSTKATACRNANGTWSPIR